MEKRVVKQESHNGRNTEKEAKATGENANSSNIAITTTVYLLAEIMKQCSTLKTRFRAATATASNEKRMESRKQPGNNTRRKYRKFGLQNMEKNMKEGKYTDKIESPMEPSGENKIKEMKIR